MGQLEARHTGKRGCGGDVLFQMAAIVEIVGGEGQFGRAPVDDLMQAHRLLEQPAEVEGQQVPGAFRRFPPRLGGAELDMLIVVIVEVGEKRRQDLCLGRRLGRARARGVGQQVKAEGFALHRIGLRPEGGGQRQHGQRGGPRRGQEQPPRGRPEISHVRNHSSTFAIAWQPTRLSGRRHRAFIPLLAFPQEECACSIRKWG